MEGLLGNNVVVQIGMVVDDIEKATRAWAAFLGMEEPAISMTDEYPVTKTQYRGAPSKARCRQSFFPLGAQVNLELIEPDHEPSYWRECGSRRSRVSSYRLFCGRYGREERGAGSPRYAADDERRVEGWTLCLP